MNLVEWTFTRMPDGTPMISFNEYEDRHNIADNIEKEINFALKFTELVREQIKKDEAFMYEKDPKTLKGMHSTMQRRGVLEHYWRLAGL